MSELSEKRVSCEKRDLTLVYYDFKAACGIAEKYYQESVGSYLSMGEVGDVLVLVDRLGKE